MTIRWGRLKLVGTLAAACLLVALAMPVLALFLSMSPDALWAGLSDSRFIPAFWLSLRTSVVSLFLTVCGGLPLAWWLHRSSSKFVGAVGLVVHVPIVVPPAVVGVALLSAFGREGLAGQVLQSIGVSLSFTPGAVVLSQVVVAAPFFIHAAATAFARVEPDLVAVARSLGASSTEAFLRVALPIALPGLISGASVAWARALGEFGATLLFAGNLSGVTQTLPLAIFSALESDVRIAVVFSLALTLLGTALLLVLGRLAASKARPLVGEITSP